jgi:predicted alpha/beta superfamily hydrolase
MARGLILLPGRRRRRTAGRVTCTRQATDRATRAAAVSTIMCAAAVACSKRPAPFIDPAPPIHVHSPSVVGDLRLHSFTSKVFGNTRFLRVLVPEGYDAPANSARRYAVLYLADGQNLFDPATSVFGPSEWRVDETLEQLIADNRIPPLIVVGVDDAGRDARAHEYLPYPDTAAAHGYPAYDPHPQGKRYPAFLIDEVMPYINMRYRTLGDAAHTGIGGSSYGALISTYVVTARPGVFGLLLAESPTFNVYGDQILRDAPAVQRWPNRVYLGVGSNEGGAPGCQPSAPPAADDYMVGNVRRLEALLHDAGLDSARLRVVVAPCATHTHASWAARLPSALTFLFADRP